jgi:Mn2+/Fe2+ NRAMP family transporter
LWSRPSIRCGSSARSSASLTASLLTFALDPKGLIPFVLIFMLILINKRGLMGTWRNGMWANLIAGATSVAMIGLTVAMVWNALH